MSRKVIAIIFCVNIILIAGALFSVTTTAAEAATTSLNQESQKEKLLNKIIKTDPLYSCYTVDVVEEDFDLKGNNEYFFVFTKKGTSKEDRMNYCADIWYGNKNGVYRILEWQYILPDTYGALKLAGKVYFRYDLSYATTSYTVLLGSKEGKCTEAFRAAGAAKFEDKSNEFTVLSDSYDSIYLKQDKYTCGHTWKNYYYYVDAKGFHEYGATKISKKEFLKYPGAEKILHSLNDKYKQDNGKVTFQFLIRSNGLLHINVMCEDKDNIYHYYVTYKIGTNHKLKQIESDEGMYQTAMDKRIAVYE